MYNMLYMETVSIRDVDSETWQAIRAEALKHKMKVGKFLKVMVEEHKAQEKDNWKDVLYRKRHVQGDEEFWRKVKEGAQEFRKGFAMREFK